MKNMSQRLAAAGALFVLGLVLTACGIGGRNNSAVSVSLKQSGTSTTVAAGSPSVTLTAAVSNATDSSLTWSFTSVPASGCGSFTSSGTSATWTIPAESALNADCDVKVTATPTANSAKATTMEFTLKAVAVALSGNESAGVTTAVGENTSGVPLSATIANDASGNGLTWALNGSACGSLSSGGKTGTSATGTSVTYIPPASGSACTATVKVAADANPNVFQTINIAVKAALSVTPATLSPITYGGSVAATQLAATGGIAPYTWAKASGPSWITVAANGALSGTPAAAGTFNITVTATDSNSGSAQQNLSLTVAPASLTVTANNQSIVQGTTLPALTAGYSGFVNGDTASALSGAPAVSTTATSSSTPGTYPITVAQGTLTSTKYTFTFVNGTLTVLAPLSITTTTLSPVTYGGSVAATQLAATGGIPPYTWAKTSGPSWINVAANGTLSGTPAAAGTFNVTVTATDSSSNSVQQNLSLTVAPATLTVTANNQSMVQGTTLPALTAGYSGFVNGDTAAALSGAPAVSTTATSSSTPGTYPITVAQGTLTSTKYTFTFVNGTLTVTPALSITTTTLSPVTYGGSVAATQLAATGGIAPYTWAKASGPSWITVAANGALSGKPAAAGTFNITVTATDSSSNSVQQNLSLTVAPASLTVTANNQSMVQGTTLPALTAGYSGFVNGDTASVLGGAPALSTTATSSSTPGTYPITVAQGTLTAASYTFTFVNGTLTVTTPGLSITTTTLSPVTYGGSVPATQLAASGGTAPYAWAKTNGPSWINVAANGTLSGTPAAAGTFNITVTATDSSSNSVQKSLSLTVAPASLTVTANNQSMVQGTTLPALTADYSGFVNGDTASVLSGAPALSTTATSSSTPGTYPITVAQGTLTAASYTFTFVNGTLTISAPAALILPSSDPVSLGAATVNTAYTGSITVSGGTGPYTWTVSGLSNGLSSDAASNSTATLNIGGTPASATPNSVSFQVSVRDSLGGTAGPITYTIAVNPGQTSGFTVSGTVSVTNGGGPLPGVTVSLVESGVSATTDQNGLFSIPNVAAGAYTVTLAPATSSAAFYAASQDVAANHDGTFTINVSANLADANFSAETAYTVSGTVDYKDFKQGATSNLMGQIFITLQSASCGSCATFGTSIPATATYPATFAIQGVPPGTYSMQAWMDILGYGVPNLSDPTGSSSVTVGNTDIATAAVTLANPSALTKPPSIPAPTIVNVSPIESGVVIEYQPILTAGGVEEAVQYNVQWTSSTDPSQCVSSPNSLPFVVTAGSGRLVILDGLNSGSLVSGLFSDGDVDYFCMQGVEADGSTGGPWATFSQSVTIGAPMAADTVSVTVNIPDWMALSGPLYTGCYDPSAHAIYAASDEAPLNNPYSVSVPDGISCQLFGIVDQNNDGAVSSAYDGLFGSGEGDIFNTNTPVVPVTISGATGSLSVDLSAYSELSIAAVTTVHQKISGKDSYSLNFNVAEALDQPVSVTLQPAAGGSATVAGPNVISPTDVPVCTTCSGPGQFAISLSTGGVRPQANDAYNLFISYIDVDYGDMPATVSGVVDDFAGSLATAFDKNGTPTFTWSDPVSSNTYTYRFTLADANGNTIWQVPAVGASLSGFPAAITAITFGTDPTGNTNNTPALSKLTSGATYQWTISVLDANGNSAQTPASFQAQ